jgi:hypothetical protein
VDDEEDEMVVNDQDVQRLVIITQVKLFAGKFLFLGKNNYMYLAIYARFIYLLLLLFNICIDHSDL